LGDPGSDCLGETKLPRIPSSRAAGRHCVDGASLPGRVRLPGAKRGRPHLHVRLVLISGGWSFFFGDSGGGCLGETKPPMIPSPCATGRHRVNGPSSRACHGLALGSKRGDPISPTAGSCSTTMLVGVHGCSWIGVVVPAPLRSEPPPWPDRHGQGRRSPHGPELTDVLDLLARGLTAGSLGPKGAWLHGYPSGRRSRWSSSGCPSAPGCCPGWRRHRWRRC
jgi:hypothetical protein